MALYSPFKIMVLCALSQAQLAPVEHDDPRWRTGFPGAVRQGQVHLRITTGTSTYDDGTLDVEVGNMADYASVTKGVFWARGDVVIDAQYPNFSGVRVRSPTNNAWIGAIEYSIDRGVNYVSLSCTDCTEGSSTARIAVDGNSDAAGLASTTCLGGATCALLPTCALFPWICARSPAFGYSYE
eukprot:scaffold54855_cov63-Phaeocystis_antarctica.AAC.2